MDTTFSNEEIAFLVSGVGVLVLVDPEPAMSFIGTVVFGAMSMVALYAAFTNGDSTNE